MKVLVNTKNMPEEEWLKWRKKGIGGSDVGSILGLNKYKSPFEVYLDKTDQIPNEPLKSEAAEWGHILEEVVAAQFSKRAGLEVRERHELLQHDTYEFMLANLDREVICPKRGIGILECKTASEYLKDEWADDKIPDAYYLQVQHYLAVTGYTFAYIAVLIGGNKFVYKPIERDEEMIEYLYKLESDFWNNHVLMNVPPAVDGSDSCKDSLNKLYADSVEECVEFSSDEVKVIEELKSVKERIKELDVKKTELENKIKFVLGEKQFGTYDGIELVTWKPNKNGRRTLKILNREVVLNG